MPETIIRPYEEKMVSSALLEIPRNTYQRGLNPERVKRISHSFDERIANEPKVSLRDGHYAGAQKMGHAIGYIYPHNCPEHWVEQQYLPDSLKGTIYYHPAENKLEGATAAYWKDLKARRKEKPKHGKNG